MSHSDGIVGLCSRIVMLHHLEFWYMSDKFKIEGIENCNFEIGVLERSNAEGYELSVKVRKDNKKSVSAKITISLKEREITSLVNNWMEVWQFTAETSKWSGVVRIDCEIVWYGTTEDSRPIQAPLNSFSNFKNLHLNSSLSDLQISISGEELSAHKFILAAHSPVFFSMFETDMKEKRENRIVIEGIELNVMKVILSILYTSYDEDLNEVEMAKNILIVAERYDMTILKRLCQWKLLQKLEVSNVLDILEAADNCNAEALRAACLDFIVQSKKLMMEAADLKTICHRKPDVVYELLKKLMSIPIDDP